MLKAIKIRLYPTETQQITINKGNNILVGYIMYSNYMRILLCIYVMII